MDRAERRRRTAEKAKSRKQDILNRDYSGGMDPSPAADYIKELEDGRFEDSYSANKWGGHCGCSKKTNTRKGHASYRHKGTYGSAMNYKPYDKRQIDELNSQLEELNSEEEE